MQGKGDGAAPIEVGLAALERVLRLGGRPLLDKLIETGMANLEQRLSELQAALAAGDADAARRAAHSVRGSSLYLGLDGLAARADAVELAAAQSDGAWRESAAGLEPGLLPELRAALEAARLRLGS